MKKLALMLPAMRMGGAEKVALNFLQDLLKYFDVTLVLNKTEGELLGQVPENVRIVEDRLLSFHEIVKVDIKKLRLIRLFQDAVYYFNVKTGRKKERNYRYLVSRTPVLNEHFDIAVGYVANVSTQIFNLADRTEADIKIAWIHGETTELHDTELFSEIYKSFDKIYAVSNVTKAHFLHRFPGCSDITDVYFNPSNKQDILAKSEEVPDVFFSGDTVNLVSVGRLSPEKGFLMLPEIAKIVSDKGRSIKWYLIGDGPQRGEIERKIKELGQEDSIFLLGIRNNPYPYMKNCDIYVQPSYEEGYCLTICEAAILRKAIVCTVPASNDILEDKKTAVVVAPSSTDLAEGIISLIDDPGKKERLIENIAKIDPTGRDRIRAFVEFVEEK